MHLFTKPEIIAALSISGDTGLDIKISNISIDSRKIKSGDLFIALSGNNFDGHNFVRDSLNNGANLAIVEKIPENCTADDNLIIVEDCYKTLVDLAIFSRERTNPKIIGLTGSVGKTSTKEMLGLALEAYSTAGNLNNHIGLPLTLANMPKETSLAILEMGMNHSGEIAKLTKIARPDIAIITNISNTHIGNFNNLEEIAAAKAEIFLGLPENGIAILNKDDDFYEFLAERAKNHRIISFGENEDADIKLTKFTVSSEGSMMEVEIDGRNYHYKTKLFDKEIAKNTLIALSAAKALNLDIEKIIKNIAGFAPAAGRGKIHQLQNNITLIDDSYNASPKSVTSALNSLNAIASLEARKIFIFGDMLELGENSQKEHENLTKIIAENNIDIVFTIGKDSKYLQEKLPKEKQGGHFENSEILANKVNKLLQKGDFVLVKGSRGIKTEKIVNSITHKS